MDTIFKCLLAVKMPVTEANVLFCGDLIVDAMECGILLTPFGLIRELREFQACYPPQLKN